MQVTLIEVFDKHFAKVKFDAKLAKEIYKFQIGYVNNNPEHLEFFGGNLLGVQVVRFKDSDLNRFYNDVLDVDYIELSNSLKAVTAINQDFKISSDVFNLTTTYLIHKFLTSKLINENIQKRAAYDCAVLFFYRCLAALISYNFRYPADPKIAQKAYANLNNKYLIKKLGSWSKVVDYRANELLSKESIHIKALQRYNDDYAIVYCLNDSQGRIRDLIKNYYAEFKKVHTEGDGIDTTSGTYIDLDGEETIKEKTKSIESYVAYARSVIVDKKSFVNDNLVSVISGINKNTSFRMVKQSLTWMSDNYAQKDHDTIDDFLSMVIVYSFHLIQENDLDKHMRDYPKLLIELKNLYLSTRSVDEDLIVIRKLGEKIVKASSPNKLSDSLVLATRTSVILYIILKVLTGK